MKAGLIMITIFGQKIIERNKGILCKAQSIWQEDPWTITTIKAQTYLFVLVSLEDYWPCYIAIDCTLCHLHYFHWLVFMVINSVHWFSPSVKLLAPHAQRRLSRPFWMLITNSLFVIVTSLQVLLWTIPVHHPTIPTSYLNLRGMSL
jgi:hypothetical protein